MLNFFIALHRRHDRSDFRLGFDSREPFFVDHLPPDVGDGHDALKPRRRSGPANRSMCVASRDSQLRLLVRALRPQQWVKNLLIFVPLILAHRLSDTSALVATAWAVVAFSACASASTC